MTRLTHTEGNHSKFWEGTVSGNSLTVRFGRIGTQGQTKVKEFDDPAAARAELAKLIKEKLAKGYIAEDGSSPKGATETPRHATPAGERTLAEALAALDSLWKDKLPKVFASLRPGVDARANQALLKALGGVAPPADLVVWFAWHDGQSSDEALSDESTFWLHSVQSAIEAWEFLDGMKEDLEHPPQPTWLPLFQNGGGDHRCYDLRSGAIVTWYHDSADRPVEFKSLRDWAEATRSVLGQLESPKPAVAASAFAELQWVKVPIPQSQDRVAALEIGTVFRYKEDLRTLGKRECLVLKTKSNTWLKGSGLNYDASLAKLEDHLRAPPGKNSGYWTSDSMLSYTLQSAAKGSVRQSKRPITLG